MHYLYEIQLLLEPSEVEVRSISLIIYKKHFFHCFLFLPGILYSFHFFSIPFYKNYSYLFSVISKTELLFLVSSKIACLLTYKLKHAMDHAKFSKDYLRLPTVTRSLICAYQCPLYVNFTHE